MKNIGNPFSTKNPVVPPIFAGRLAELEHIKDTILIQNSSVSISGYFGIGKSSVILTMFEHLKGVNSKLLPIHITEHSLRSMIRGDFLSLLTHEICANIWLKIFGGKYSELLDESLSDILGKDLESKGKSTLKRIFRIATSQTIIASGSQGSVFSAKLVVEGRKDESGSISFTRNPMQAFEFHLLLDELMAIIQDNGYEKVVIVCDQLNHAPVANDTVELAEHLEVLGSKNIQFIVSAMNPEAYEDAFTKAQDVNDFLKAFSTWVELGAYRDSIEISEHFRNGMSYLGANVDIQDEAAGTALELTDGIPWFLTKLFQRVFDDLALPVEDEVLSSHIEKYSKRFLKAVTQYKSENGKWWNVNLEDL